MHNNLVPFLLFHNTYISKAYDSRLFVSMLIMILLVELILNLDNWIAMVFSSPKQSAYFLQYQHGYSVMNEKTLHVLHENAV